MKLKQDAKRQNNNIVVEDAFGAHGMKWSHTIGPNLKFQQIVTRKHNNRRHK